MAIIDIVLLLCFVPAIVSGVSKGFVKQVVEIAALLIGVWVAFRYSSLLSIWLSQQVEMDKLVLHVLCFIAILIVTAALLSIAGHFVTRVVNLVSLGWVNRVLGFFFGIIKVAIILGLLILAFEALNSTVHIIEDKSLDNAVVYNGLKGLGEEMFPFLKNLIAGF